MSTTPRRSFLNWFLATSGGALLASILYPILNFLSPPSVPEAASSQVEAGFTNDPDLLENGFKIIRFGAEPVILIRLADDSFRAFAATCTHLDCIVEYQKNQRRIWCNCHNGEYDLAGQNVAGPAPKPLEPYGVELLERGGGQPKSVIVTRSSAT